MSYIGRLAPSPTGAQHLGNARTFMVAWLACRSEKGKLLLRIEDLDTPRTKEGATEQLLEDLRWLGLDWDAACDASYTTQSDRESRYRQVLHDLQERELVYPCTCTRSEIDRVASAPHESALDGAIYPGTCAARSAADARSLDAEKTPYSWRFRMPCGLREFHDQRFGPQSLDAKVRLGDFIVARSYGVTAYQLAVVVDDHDAKINHVVRGSDLIYSTYRQLAIYEAMDWTPPNWLHLPLVVGPDGRRLAKRHGDTRLSTFREQGVAPESILGFLAQTLGITADKTPVRLSDLLAHVSGEPNWIQRIPLANCTLLGNQFP
jgi:glutamyl-tRNA synthetase